MAKSKQGKTLKQAESIFFLLQIHHTVRLSRQLLQNSCLQSSLHCLTLITTLSVCKQICIISPKCLHYPKAPVCKQVYITLIQPKTSFFPLCSIQAPVWQQLWNFSCAHLFIATSSVAPILSSKKQVYLKISVYFVSCNLKAVAGCAQEHKAVNLRSRYLESAWISESKYYRNLVS